VERNTLRKNSGEGNEPEKASKLDRLQKLISLAGVASRRHAEEMILSGRVTVNGKVIRTLGSKADPNKDHVKVDGKLLLFHHPPLYILMNKPKGVITSLSDPLNRPTVRGLLRGVKSRVYPVGRLDYDTEGLLLLTNDGELAEHLMHPRSEVQKGYWAKVRGTLSETETLKLTRGGMALSQGKTAPCQIRTLRKSGENSWVEIILHEGKKRQVREMLERVGHPISKLKRVRYAFLTLDNLLPGEWRYLTQKEVAKLKKIGYKRTHAQAPHPNQ
jgi:23S rRNA pseudouridine2605 synthase